MSFCSKSHVWNKNYGKYLVILFIHFRHFFKNQRNSYSMSHTQCFLAMMIVANLLVKTRVNGKSHFGQNTFYKESTFLPLTSVYNDCWSLLVPCLAIESRTISLYREILLGQSSNAHTFTFRYFPFLSPRIGVFVNSISEIFIQPPEKMFKVNTVPQCPKKILQLYQADENMGINVTGGFEVKTKDKTFSSSIFPFLQTDHLADQLIGKP